MKIPNFKDLILWENEHYLLINKPPHVSSLDERTADKSLSIIRMAKSYLAEAQLAHRLDKETSGVMAIAKNPEAYRHLSMQFEKRQVDKIYHAISDGIHDFEGVLVELPILPLPIGIVKIDKAEGKEAATIFNTLEVFKKHTLIECRPLTGRMHQIRIHLACLDAPIVSDTQYGGKRVYLSELKKKFNLKKDTDEQPLISRVALHAHTLAFRGLDEEVIEASAPYPKDIQALVRQLANNA